MLLGGVLDTGSHLGTAFCTGISAGFVEGMATDSTKISNTLGSVGTEERW